MALIPIKNDKITFSDTEKLKRFKKYIKCEVEFLLSHFGGKECKNITVASKFDLTKVIFGWGLSANDLKLKLMAEWKKAAGENWNQKEISQIWKEQIQKQRFEERLLSDDLNANKKNKKYNALKTVYSEFIKKLGDLVCVHYEHFKRDIIVYERQLETHNVFFNIQTDTILRLSLWSSIFTNDEYGLHSPLGPYSIYVGEHMGHHSIGIIDALNQLVWLEEYEETPDTLTNNLWRLDLMRAQLIVISISEIFSGFLSQGKGEKNFCLSAETITLMFDQWKKCKETCERNKVRLDKLMNGNPEHSSNHELSSEREGLIYQLNRAKTKAEGKLQRVKNIVSKENTTREIFSKKLKKNVSNSKEDEKSEEEGNKDAVKFESYFNSLRNYLDGKSDLNGLLVSTLNLENKEFLSDLWLELYEATLMQINYKHPPLIQLINGNSSSWAGNGEVPSFIVLNGNRATDSDRLKRLAAYSAVPHELGHVIADSFIDDQLINELKGLVKLNQLALDFPKIWTSWLGEIFADIISVWLFGIHAIKGLWEAMDAVKVPDYVIQGFMEEGSLYLENEEVDFYASHPTPILRIQLVLSVFDRYLESNEKIKRKDSLEEESKILRDEWEVWTLESQSKVFISKDNAILNGEIEESVLKTGDKKDEKVKRDKEVKRRTNVLNKFIYYKMVLLSEEVETTLPDELEFISGLDADKKFGIVELISKSEHQNFRVRKLYDEVGEKEININEFKSDIQKILDFMLDNKCATLNNRTIKELLSQIVNDEQFRDLSSIITSIK